MWQVTKKFFFLYLFFLKKFLIIFVGLYYMEFDNTNTNTNTNNTTTTTTATTTNNNNNNNYNN